MAYSAVPLTVVGTQISESWCDTYIKANFEHFATHAHTGASNDGSSALSDVDTVIFDHQGSDPSAPASGHATVYMKSDGLYFRNTGGSATRLALSSDTLTIGQVVEADGSQSQNYGDGDTSEETLVTASITAGGAGRVYVITAGTSVAASTASTVNATFKLYYDTTLLETVNDTDLVAGDRLVMSQTQANPATSSKVIKLTVQIASGGSHISYATLSIREIYTA